MNPIKRPKFPVPQRVVTISIKPNGKTYKALYSYTSPVTGLQYFRAPKCLLDVDQPTYCLFVLDFDATAAGWTITKIMTEPGALSIENDLGALNLSIMTFDPHNKPPLPPLQHLPFIEYSFSIYYYNTTLKKEFHEDPQERNGPRAIDSPP